MIPMAPMFEAMPGFLKTAKNYWFGGSQQQRPQPRPDEGGSVREKYMTAAKKATTETEGGVGGTMRRIMNKNKMLAQAGDM